MVGRPPDSSLMGLAVGGFVETSIERSLRHGHLRRRVRTCLGGGRLVESRLTGPLHAHSQSCFRCLVDSNLRVAEVAHILKRAATRVINMVEARCRLRNTPRCISQRCRRLRCLHRNERILLLRSRSLQSIGRSLLNHRVIRALRAIGHARLLLL